MFENIKDGVIANILSTVLLTALFLITFIVFYVLNRRSLYKFFGLTHLKSTLQIYMSRLEIKPQGTTGFEEVKFGYHGPAINKIEYDAALSLRDLFHSNIFALLPRRLEDWFGNRSIILKNINPQIDISPTKLSANVFQGNLILLGSPIYNIVTKYYLERKAPFYYFAKKANGERVVKRHMNGIDNDIEISGRSEKKEIGIIQRISDTEHSLVVFICAGLGTSATFGSLHYLIQHWRQLQRSYDDDDFALLLAFDNQEPDDENVKEPVLVEEHRIKISR